MIKKQVIELTNSDKSVARLITFTAKAKNDMFSRSKTLCYKKDVEVDLYYHTFDGRIAIYRTFHTKNTPTGNSYKLYNSEDDILEDFTICE